MPVELWHGDIVGHSASRTHLRNRPLATRPHFAGKTARVPPPVVKTRGNRHDLIATSSPRCVRARFGAPGSDHGAGRTGSPIVSRRPFECELSGQLVCRALQGPWLRGVLIAFWKAKLHYGRGSQRSSFWTQPPRRSASRRPSVHRND